MRFLGSFVFQHIIFFTCWYGGQQLVDTTSIHGDLTLWLEYTGQNFVVHFFIGIIVGRELNVDYKNFADLSIRIKVFL